MRIIAGRFKGRVLASPPASGVRPTSDRLRETLFNLVDPGAGEARVLDAFAGTGALGLEALSRGAAHVTFVERDRRAARVIAENVARCGAASACAIVVDDFVGVTARRPLPGPFDLVLLDPPYDDPNIGAALEEAAGLVRPGGLVVLEHRCRSTPPSATGLSLRRTVTAGNSALSLYAIM
jgi:16S rRNA (guanine966-N2)-methyltransferase